MFLVIHTLNDSKEKMIYNQRWHQFCPHEQTSLSLSVRVSGRSSVLQVFSRGSWRTVCAEGWDSHLGSVACRQLGYNRYRELQCTMTQLYSSGISAPKKKLAPRDSKVEKKNWMHVQQHWTALHQTIWLEISHAFKKNSTFGTLKVFWKFADFFRLLWLRPSLSFLPAGCE